MKKAVCLILSLLAVFLIPSAHAVCDSAAAYAVINGDTGETLCSKNGDTRLAMASTTKIMTALLLCEAFDDPETVITVSDRALPVEGTCIGLRAGDKISVRALLCGMLLASGNDAANAAACAVSGSTENFVRLMNEKAKALGLSGTSFATPSGLDGEGHHTTARDLAILAMYALKNEKTAEICAQKYATVKYGSPPAEHTFKNHNRLLFYYDDVIGVKTGFTKKAGRCLVSAARREGKYVIAVTLNDKNDWQDHRRLLDAGYGLLNGSQRVSEAYDLFIPTADGKKVAVTVPGFRYYSRAGTRVTVNAFLPGFVYAPVKAGEPLGSVEYLYEYRTVKRTAVKAQNGIKAEKYSLPKRIKTLFYLIITGTVRT